MFFRPFVHPSTLQCPEVDVRGRCSVVRRNTVVAILQDVESLEELRSKVRVLIILASELNLLRRRLLEMGSFPPHGRP